jgi:CRISPR-associated exonuclease Cas4
MYTEDELLPVSALQHLVFCERQCALIHVERKWRDNPLTLEGSRLHKRTDEDAPRVEKRGDLVLLRGAPLHSFRLGLAGKADVVELHRSTTSDGTTCKVAGIEGIWTVVPVEYKRGRPKKDICDEVQLCAQAVCLEEMLGARVEKGHLYYGARKRRTTVSLDGCSGRNLRSATESAARRLREIVDTRCTPRAEKGPKCSSCSMREICIPDVTGGSKSVDRYLAMNVTRDARGDVDD